MKVLIHKYAHTDIKINKITSDEERKFGTSEP